MTTIRVTRKKRLDPFQAEIDRRLALRRAAEQRLASRRPIAAAETLHALADYMREHPVTVLIMEGADVR